MEPIQSALKKWMRDKESFKANYLKIRKEVLEDPDVKDFLSRHPELPKKEIEKSLMKLYEYKTQSKQCDTCQSLDKCVNMIKGYSPVLNVDNNEIHLSYEKCYMLIDYEKERKRQKLIQSLYMPKDILHASFDSIDYGVDRSKAVRQMIRFVDQAKKDLPAKGLFLTGPFGVGKTYFLGAIANRLKEYNISSMLIYMPEFVREMKGSIKDDSLNRKIDYFKKADVLMLDDIGAETQSAWFRDEILGSILQYRMMERLPVFFTSNYTLVQLKEHLAVTNRGEYEKVKSRRIIERIQQVSTEIVISGENRRE